MKEFSTIQLKRMTDDMIINAIGNFIRNERLERNLTQAKLAERAGLNRTTIRDLEFGRRCTLITLIQVLRSLNQLDVLKNFKVSKELSPLELARLDEKRRKRASGSINENDPKSDW
jgi:transcriptional regulator with XRE-family HTH domain